MNADTVIYQAGDFGYSVFELPPEMLYNDERGPVFKVTHLAEDEDEARTVGFVSERDAGADLILEHAKTHEAGLILLLNSKAG